MELKVNSIINAEQNINIDFTAKKHNFDEKNNNSAPIPNNPEYWQKKCNVKKPNIKMAQTIVKKCHSKGVEVTYSFADSLIEKCTGADGKIDKRALNFALKAMYHTRNTNCAFEIGNIFQNKSAKEFNTLKKDLFTLYKHLNTSDDKKSLFYTNFITAAGYCTCGNIQENEQKKAFITSLIKAMPDIKLSKKDLDLYENPDVRDVLQDAILLNALKDFYSPELTGIFEKYIDENGNLPPLAAKKMKEFALFGISSLNFEEVFDSCFEKKGDYQTFNEDLFDEVRNLISKDFDISTSNSLNDVILIAKNKLNNNSLNQKTDAKLQNQFDEEDALKTQK